MKRYKQNKEKLKRQKELLLEQSKKHTVPSKGSKNVATPKSTKSSKKHKITVKTKLKEMVDSEAAKKIKESFRSSMAVVMVSILNTYRKPDCKEGRITNTEDFKHLARKVCLIKIKFISFINFFNFVAHSFCYVKRTETLPEYRRSHLYGKRQVQSERIC